ncbi:hypothetical protein LL946_03255 [Knoellia locipacati]|uniref:hypothetical protein n=1 Tax=Knoellia locipacati TaxID=882824 RepID=UPI0038516C2E
MSHTTSFRRGLTVAGATGILAFSVAGPASARPDPGNGAQQEWTCQIDCYEGGTTTGPTTAVTLDDDALEMFQLGAGVLAGIALAGAGLAVASRRSHRHAVHPA